jgi:isopenicillin-N epimerase
VLEIQAEFRAELEANAVRFLDRQLEGRVDRARTEVAEFLGADASGLAFLPNATTGVATVLASLRLRPGDEILVTDHEYNATLNAVRRIAAERRADVVVAHLPLAPRDGDDVVARIVGAATARTRVALVSHVTSPTALALPIARIVAELAARGIETIVDGAHAAGMVDLDVGSIGAPWYVADGHKWLCGPKGTAILVVREDHRSDVHPLVTSHGANDPRTDRSRFRLEFDWLGTIDPTPHLALPAAIRWLGATTGGGWPGLRAANHAGVLAARDALVDRLGLERSAPETLIGSMAALPLPLDPRDEAGARDLRIALADEDGVEVAIGGWPVSAARRAGDPATAIVLRVSWQRYNEPWELERLVVALGARLAFV